jgi:hypothetical protein
MTQHTNAASTTIVVGHARRCVGGGIVVAACVRVWLRVRWVVVCVVAGRSGAVGMGVCTSTSRAQVTVP